MQNKFSGSVSNGYVLIALLVFAATCSILCATLLESSKFEGRRIPLQHDSQVLEDYWPLPITAEQLQAEMDRMAQHTKQPEVLRELFEALGNDPIIIAECVARPALVARLMKKSYGRTQGVLGSDWARAQYRVRNAMVGDYTK